jgi:hypothetical protein
MKDLSFRRTEPPYKDVFAWFPVRLCHPAYGCPTGKWVWRKRVRRITRRRRSIHVEIPQD